MKYDQLINKEFHKLQRNKLFKDKERFIYNEISHRINLSIDSINLQFSSCLEIGYSSNIIYQYIYKKFPKIDYYIADISKKILKDQLHVKNSIYLDHDKWNVDNDKFDLIISNLYLNLTNNLGVLFQNLYCSLKEKGFLIVTFPGKNSLDELKKCMIEADLEIYEGAYRRFIECHSINDITNILNKENFKIPVIEIDTIKLRYKKFTTLLNDIRYLGNSNIYKDRKDNFENKKYFQKVEDIYWKKYSNNEELILHLEVIFISAWKDKILK